MFRWVLKAWPLLFISAVCQADAYGDKLSSPEEIAVARVNALESENYQAIAELAHPLQIKAWRDHFANALSLGALEKPGEMKAFLAAHGISLSVEDLLRLSPQDFFVVWFRAISKNGSSPRDPFKPGLVRAYPVLENKQNIWIANALYPASSSISSTEVSVVKIDGRWWIELGKP